MKLISKVFFVAAFPFFSTIAAFAQVSSATPTDGESYVVAAYVNSKYYALPNGTTNGSTIAGDEITLNALNKVNTATAADKTWTLEEDSENSGQFYLKYTSGVNTYYLYKNGTGGSNYNFKVSTGSKNYWSFTADGTGYTVAAVDRGTNNVNIQYNNGTFRCYSSATKIILLEIGNVSAITCATPSFSPSAGSYTSTQNVTISTETVGATIHYTTDGTDPTSSSPTYTSPISVSTTQTIKAIAVKDGANDSSVGSARYVLFDHAGTDIDPYAVADARQAIDENVGTTGVYVKGIVCTGGSDLSGGSMNYWISDDGTETDKFEIYKGKSYSGASFSSTSEIQAGDIVIVSGNITKFSSTYEFSSGSQLVNQIRKPVFSPASGPVGSGTNVTLSSNADATIYYTTDGSEPTTGSTVYSAPITVTVTTTIKAFAVRSGLSSDIVSVDFEVLTPVETPTFSPGTGTYTWAQHVTISTTTDGATIYYTTDGSEPTTGSTVYSGAIEVNETMIIKALATKAGMGNSSIASATYTMNIPVINAANVNLDFGDTAGSIAFTISNPVDGGVTSAEITAGNDGTWLSTGSVTTSVPLTCTVNEGESARAATVTLTYTYNTDKTVTKDVTVTQAKVDYASLPFVYVGGTKDNLTARCGVTGSGLGTNYADQHAPYRVKFDTNGDYIIIKTNKQIGVVSFDIKKAGGANSSSITVQGSADGSVFTDIQTFSNPGDLNAVLKHVTTNAFGASDRYVKILFNKPDGGSNVGIGPITISPATITATFKDGRYWTTYYNSAARYILPEGAQAFTMDVDHKLYVLGDDGSVIPAGTAVIIISDKQSITLTKSNSSEDIKIHDSDDYDGVDNNILKGSNTSDASDSLAGTPYVLGIVGGNLGLYEFTGDDLPAMKAYVEE